jgi:hypothetical protein
MHLPAATVSWCSREFRERGRLKPLFGVARDDRDDDPRYHASPGTSNPQVPSTPHVPNTWHEAPRTESTSSPPSHQHYRDGERRSCARTASSVSTAPEVSNVPRPRDAPARAVKEIHRCSGSQGVVAQDFNGMTQFMGYAGLDARRRIRHILTPVPSERSGIYSVSADGRGTAQQIARLPNFHWLVGRTAQQTIRRLRYPSQCRTLALVRPVGDAQGRESRVGTQLVGRSQAPDAQLSTSVAQPADFRVTNRLSTSSIRDDSVSS